MTPHDEQNKSTDSCDSNGCGCGPQNQMQRREFVQMLGVGAVALPPAALGRTAQAQPGESSKQRSQVASNAGGYSPRQSREYNGPYSGEYLDRVAFPVGGIGAGMFCLEGTGAISHVSMRHEMEAFNEPCSFAALCVKGSQGNVAKILEGSVPDWKVFGRPGNANGSGHTSYGFPRFEQCQIVARFPFATIELEDADVPLNVSITGWSPFVPGDADNSSLPVGALEYTFSNTSRKNVEAVFSYSTTNFMSVRGGGDSIKAFDNGFLLWQEAGEREADRQGGCAIYVDDDEAVVDHCWFRGAWFDSLTLAWENVREGRLLDNPPVEGSCPGATLFVPVNLKPGQSKTLRLMFTWYVPKTDLRSGRDASGGRAFGQQPSHGTAPQQQEVSGYRGEGLVNTFDPRGDAATGKLTSPKFAVNREHLQFLIGGGSEPNKTCLNLLVDGEVVKSATGKDRERLEWVTWDVSEWSGKQATIEIVDESTRPWGHINVDHVMLTNQPGDDVEEIDDAVVLADFEGGDYGDWTAEGPPEPENQQATPVHHVPWYAGRFSSITEISDYWKSNYQTLREQSAAFRDAFYDTTLPPEVIEAVAANLTILKSPTVLRQTDGRLWCWEGCTDSSGCCAGSCTHVWNYAQAICHLFPELERSLRITEFNESQASNGHQTFRAALPIRPVDHSYHAASDGQLGGIMKVYREWRISGDTDWLRSLWPKVRQSLDFCIDTWDPRGKGALEEPHHNTYDIEYWGPNGHCTSFYLGALAAATKMGTAIGDDVARYEQLLEKGIAFLEEELYDGEYFFHKIQTEGLDAEFNPLRSARNGTGYEDVIEELNEQGPKYQYGTGCLSDGVLGFWMAQVCGVGQVIDDAKVKSNLNAIHRYNFKADLSDHANPQRPTYAYGSEGGLLLCTWPKGGELSIPFVYSNEVWTGIEYQVASHLMIEGMVEQGLDIVRACRDRYDGRVRNPFNEFECGHWYARAMSSYGLLQGLTGVRYDAVDQTLYIDSRVGENFKGFLCTANGYGTAGLKNGVPFLDVRQGAIPVKQTVVSGAPATLTKTG